MRGTLCSKRVRQRLRGIIPAYAGNTTAARTLWPCRRDHPRVCGEHAVQILAARIEWGSSPRMRGTRRDYRRDSCCRGIIPAYAGNTSSMPSRAQPHRDHPRVCGEHLFGVLAFLFQQGSSPRMRGTPGRCRLRARSTGIIPAYAGNTSFFQRPSSKRRDHPRVCGEHLKMHRPEAAVWGSSPRMRGTPFTIMLSVVGLGIIPAYAGNTEHA